MLKPLTSLALMCFATTAMADVTIVMKDTSGADGVYNSTSTVRVKDGTVVMSEDENDGGAIMFKKADSTIVQIDHESRSYMVIDEAMANQMSAAFSKQMAMVQEKLKNLPPEQREMIMARMPQMMEGGGSQPERTVERTGKTETISGFSCEVVNVHTEGQRTGGACVASPKELGMSKSDFGTIKSMMAAMGALAKQMGTNEMPDFDAVGGFPIKYNNSHDDDQSFSVLQSVNTEELSEKYFAIPEGYTQRSFGR